MKRLFKLNFIIFLLIISLFGCEKDNLSVQKEKIIGTWVQIEPTCTNPDCDNVIFRSDGKLTSNIHFIGEKIYQVISTDSILIESNKHYYQLINNDKNLFIEDFITLDFGNEKENILLFKN